MQFGSLRLVGGSAIVARLAILGVLVALIVWRGLPRWPVLESEVLWVVFITYGSSAAAMIGMFVGSAVAVGEWHSLIGLALIVISYARKIPLEERSLRAVFGPADDEYREARWALIPWVF